MASFDKQQWKERARLRFEKARKYSKSKDIDEKYGRDLVAITGIEKVIAWCNERSLVVNFTRDSDGTFEPNDSEIEITGRGRPETQLFWLLHECGHFLIERCESRVAHGIIAEALNDKRSLVARVALVDEESEAWDRGKSLAERLGIHVSQERFNEFRAKALATYFKWATRN